ncbi:MAG: hypothetical protein IKC61_03270 [Clostridia bacterium]|nr:hypothetical protein [Clostridia bacterium]
MTVSERGKTAKKEIGSLLILSMTVLIGIMISGEGGEYVQDGMRLAVECVIPTALPFMIIADLYVCYGHPDNIRLLKKVFTILFGISAHGLAPFICGNIGGFPIGAKMTADSYTMGLLTRDEAERLLALCNNPSCAFIVGGVGLGIYQDIRIGFLLFASVHIATVICGLVTRRKPTKNHFSNVTIKQNYSFVSSVKNAGLSSIGIISFVSIFSGINGIIKKRIKYAPLLYLISSLSEVTNAVKIFATSSSIPHSFALSLTAFSLGFGGICVALQSSVFTSSAGLGMRKYFLIKLSEGILSASVFSILFTAIK